MGQPDEENYSPDEAIAVFRSLSDVELNKLGRIASFIAGSGGYAPPQELINESFIRIAEGKRRWPRNVAFLAFVGGVMKSLATDGNLIPEERKLVRLKQGLTIVNSEDLMMVAANDDGADLARKQRLEDAMSKLQAHFAGDGEMEMLLMGIEDGLRGKDLQDAVGVDAKRLEALRTRMNRHIEKLANESWAKEGRP
ncbi:transposase [Rhizobium leguminosarum]|uniref:transposase n=1 Tax=Rhizobium leguminosarum TaxID=384 RepID=UPI001C941072|nr:transposase [Rhizobium leguminosarum]MBY5505336.1 transposase [Rhizobium leguminosarum]